MWLYASSCIGWATACWASCIRAPSSFYSWICLFTWKAELEWRNSIELRFLQREHPSRFVLQVCICIVGGLNYSVAMIAHSDSPVDVSSSSMISTLARRHWLRSQSRALHETYSCRLIWERSLLYGIHTTNTPSCRGISNLRFAFVALLVTVYVILYDPEHNTHKSAWKLPLHLCRIVIAIIASTIQQFNSYS